MCLSNENLRFKKLNVSIVMDECKCFMRNILNMIPLGRVSQYCTRLRDLVDLYHTRRIFIFLLILFLMAATSHDFWLENLSPRMWKALHMMVYVAYALIVLHVALGVLQQEGVPSGAGLLGLGMVSVIGLHVLAGMKEKTKESPTKGESKAGFLPVCKIDEIEADRAKVVILKEENIAIFKYDGKLSAINNVCKHQNGPLGEGKNSRYHFCFP